MIAPPTAFHVGQRPFVSPMSPLIEKFRDEHQEDKVKDQPDLKDDLSLPMVGVSILHKKIVLILLISCAKGQSIRKLIGGGGAGEVQKKYSRKGKLNEKKILHTN